jgi:molybdate transport system substrate-binding protein
LLALVVITFAGMSAHAAERKAVAVSLFAAASTTDCLNAVIAAYERHGLGRIIPSYASSSTLARQIAAGAPADIFISANKNWMGFLLGRALISVGSRRDLLANRLVLVAPESSNLKIEIGPGFALAAALGDRRLAVGDPDHVPAGIYAKRALEHLGVWAALAPKLARSQHVRATLALVVRGEVAAGIVYATDARITPRVRVIGTFPATSHPPITYPVAIVVGSESPSVQRFFDFLLAPGTAKIFERFGFHPATMKP